MSLETNNETKITLSKEDNEKHFDWCWNKVIDNFKKEEINLGTKWMLKQRSFLKNIES